MCAFDIVVLLILGGMTFRGGLSGIISQVASIISVIAGWYVSTRYFSYALPYFAKWPEWQKPISMLAVFIVAFLAIKIIALFFQRFISFAHMKEFDRQMGALLGLVKGLIVCIVLTYIAVIACEKTKNAVVESQSGKYITMVILKIEQLLPDQFKEYLAENNIRYFSEIVKDTGLLEKATLGTEIQSIKDRLRKSGIVSENTDPAPVSNNSQTKESDDSSAMRLSSYSFTQEKEPAQSSFWPFSSGSSGTNTQNSQNTTANKISQNSQNNQDTPNTQNNQTVLNTQNTTVYQNNSSYLNGSAYQGNSSDSSSARFLDGTGYQNISSYQNRSDYSSGSGYQNNSSWQNRPEDQVDTNTQSASNYQNTQVYQNVPTYQNSVQNPSSNNLRITDETNRYSSADFTERTSTAPINVAPSF